MIRWMRGRCDFCGICVGVCPVTAIVITESDLSVDEECCVTCGNCVDSCPVKAFSREEVADEGGV